MRRSRKDLTPAQGVAGLMFGGAVLLLAEGHFHAALTLALAATVTLLVGLHARDKANRDEERLAELRFRGALSESIVPALEVANLELRIADLEKMVEDLGKDHPEFQGLHAELAATRVALADMTAAFLTETAALHGANEVLRFDLEVRTAELAAARSALTELAIGCFAERANLQRVLREQAEDEVRKEMDVLDSFGLDALAHTRRLEAQLAETGMAPWIRGLLLSPTLRPDQPVPIFRIVVNGHAEVKFTDAALLALQNPN